MMGAWLAEHQWFVGWCTVVFYALLLSVAR